MISSDAKKHQKDKIQTNKKQRRNKKRRNAMPVKRIILTVDPETEEKVRKKAKELHYSTVQRYIYDLIRRDILKDKKISQNQEEIYSQKQNPSNSQRPLTANDIIINQQNTTKSSSDINYQDLSIESIAQKLAQDFPNLSHLPQRQEKSQETQQQRKKLPSELIFEHVEREATAQETLRKLQDLGN